LTHKDLLSQGGTVGREATPLCIQIAKKSLLSEKRRLDPAVRIGHSVAFARASLKASWKLRLQSIQQTVRGVAIRKNQRGHPQTANDRTLRELVAVFHHFRPYYAREYLCLYDSLALVEFLAHNHLFPLWVFGVKTEPFSAHCWVQECDFVLNDSVEYVCGFTPIMAV
jgi:hypothetical protein